MCACACVCEHVCVRRVCVRRVCVHIMEASLMLPGHIYDRQAAVSPVSIATAVQLLLLLCFGKMEPLLPCMCPRFCLRVSVLLCVYQRLSSTAARRLFIRTTALRAASSLPPPPHQRRKPSPSLSFCSGAWKKK